MNFEEYVKESRPSVPSLVDGEKFLVASVKFDEIFVEENKKAPRTIFVEPSGALHSSLGSVVHRQAKFLETYFAKGGEPVEVEAVFNTTGKRDYWVLLHGERTIPTAE